MAFLASSGNGQDKKLYRSNRGSQFKIPFIVNQEIIFYSIQKIRFKGT